MTPEQELAELKQLIKQLDELMTKIDEYGDGAGMYDIMAIEARIKEIVYGESTDDIRKL